MYTYCRDPQISPKTFVYFPSDPIHQNLLLTHDFRFICGPLYLVNSYNFYFLHIFLPLLLFSPSPDGSPVEEYLQIYAPLIYKRGYRRVLYFGPKLIFIPPPFLKMILFPSRDISFFDSCNGLFVLNLP